MKISDLGFNNKRYESWDKSLLDGFVLGRVIAEHKERYVVMTEEGEFDAEITGHLRYAAEDRADYPAVGDWVTLTVYDGSLAIIHRVMPRVSTIARQAVGKHGEIQIIGTNIDYTFLVQAVDRDFSLNRLERYLTICNASKIDAYIILTKTDLIDTETLEGMKKSIAERIKNVPLLAISNLTTDGIDQIKAIIKKGKTYCMLGSSGVGKSTLLNLLSGKETMKTREISEATDRGKHTTTHRELILLEGGGIIIDNPGMREVGVADSGEGLETTFDHITALSKRCKYVDCTHTVEAGCAVLAALETGELDAARYENYLTLEKEKAHFESTVLDRKKRDKEFGKMMKNFKKDRKRNGF